MELFKLSELMDLLVNCAQPSITIPFDNFVIW